MKNILIIGAGQLGSRHLQALKNVRAPLNINVIDTSENSLKIAKERYDSIENLECLHKIKYIKTINELDVKDIEIAILATNSNVRRIVIETLLKKANVKYFILEKLLFQKKQDYFDIQKLIKEKGTKTFVNCSMRAMSLYHDIKDQLKSNKIVYTVTGSQFYLVTNLIHYLDHIAYLSNCSEFEADTRGMDKLTIPSSRPGYREINGTYIAHFKNGSIGIFTCHNQGDAPITVQFYNQDLHCISKESEGKVWLSKANDNWNWNEIDFAVPYQSQVTTHLVEQILENGTCPLVEYDETMKMHLILLDSLSEFLKRETEEEYDIYPFT